jgi:hypothetical protein
LARGEHVDQAVEAVASGQEYEVRDFADKFDISPGDARDLIDFRK